MALGSIFDRAFNILGGALGGVGQAAANLPGQAGQTWDEFAQKALPGGADVAVDYGLPGGGVGANWALPGGGGQPNWSLPGGGGGADYGLPGGGLGTDYTLPGGGAGYGPDYGAQAAQATRDLYTPRRTPSDPYASSPTGQTASGAAGSWGVHEGYRELITKYAQQYGLDPDAVAAFARIETGHLPAGQVAGATSHAGAMGVLQVMPFHFGPGENGYDPETNIRVGLRFFADMYKRFGDYGLAAAAYHGGPGAIVNGKPRNDNSDGNMTSADYYAAWQQNYADIKATAPTMPTGSGVASLFGGQMPPVSQGFGHTGYSTGPGASVYDFGTEFGLDGDEHTGWDIASPRGTQFYMPAGLVGTVTIAGGSGYYKSNNGPDSAGKGELRIRLSNGWELILGHNDRIDVRVGQQVTAGMLLGLTGSSDGDHIHIEVRRPSQGRTRSGWEIVDPSLLFGGAPPGGGGRH